MTTLGLSLIVKDELNGIKKLFDSIKPIKFDHIFVAQTIENKEVREFLESRGAEVGFFKWEDDFSKARNYALENCKADYVMWLDSDDIVENPEKVRGVFYEALANNSHCIYFPYHYRYDNNGYLTIVICRERIVRKDNFSWEGMIDETLETKRSGIPFFSDDVIIKHNQKEKNDADRFQRNYTVSKKQWDKKKTNKSILDYAMALADLGKDKEAFDVMLDFLERYTDKQGKYLSFVFKGNLCLNLKKYEMALEYFEWARLLFPEIGEPYFKKAEAYNYLFEWQKIKENCEIGFELNIPVNVRFAVHVLNYTLRPAKLYANALKNLGLKKESLAVINHTLQSFPTDEWLNKERRELYADILMSEVLKETECLKREI